VADASDDLQTLAERSAAAMQATDRVAPALGMRVTAVAPGACTMTMTVRPDLGNGHEVCHGGLIFALADSAFAYACNSGGGTTLAATGSIDFLAPARVGDELTAVAQELWRSGRSGIYEVIVTNKSGARIALFRGRSHQVSASRPGPPEGT
jgi:acyl-CoA thioesterase